MAFLRQCLHELRARQGDQHAHFLNDPAWPDQHGGVNASSQSHSSLTCENRCANDEQKKTNTILSSVQSHEFTTPWAEPDVPESDYLCRLI